MHQVELAYLAHVLDKNNGNKTLTAKELGVSLKTVYNRINEMSSTTGV